MTYHVSEFVKRVCFQGEEFHAASVAAYLHHPPVHDIASVLRKEAMLVDEEVLPLQHSSQRELESIMQELCVHPTQSLNNRSTLAGYLVARCLHRYEDALLKLMEKNARGPGVHL